MTKEIVLVGRSNVGKSTLFRELTGHKVRVGRRPGITRVPTRVRVGNLIYVDMPGYGFMLKASKAELERTKDQIVKYMEEHCQEILLVVQVTDAASFLEIADRWEARGQVPLEIELWAFISDLGLDAVLAANKMDHIANPEEALDLISERLGMLPPWRQWQDRIAPIMAKKGRIEPLKEIIKKRAAGKKD